MITSLWGFDFTVTFFAGLILTIACIIFIVLSVVVDDKWIIVTLILSVLIGIGCVFFQFIWICSCIYMIVKIIQGDGGLIPVIDIVLLVISLISMVLWGISGDSKE